MITKNISAVLLLILLSLSLMTVSAQTAFDSLDINNVNARFYAGGDMFWDLVGSPKFEAPQQSNPAAKRHAMFASALWIGGLDQSGDVRMAGQTYRQGGLDFWSGPLTSTATTDSTTIAEHDTIWTITRSEVNAFVNEYAANGSIANPGQYPNVYGWPAFTQDAN